jgi:hypothetical protein
VRNAYKIVVGKPGGKKPLRIYGRRLKDNIKVKFGRFVCDDTDWFNLAQDMGQFRDLFQSP